MKKLDAKKWDQVWGNHLENYLDAVPRTGIAIFSLLGGRINKVLEIACGSGRDSYYLFQKNMKVTAIDYADNTIEKLSNHFPKEMDFQAQDAFSLKFKDKEFDMSFHNGFYVLFNDDEDIKRLIIEQARVTKKQMIIIEHNIKNKKLVDKFTKKSVTDPIYNIRFFDADELVELVKISGVKYRNISVRKFGSNSDILYTILNRLKWLGFLQPIFYWLVPRLYQFSSWSNVERVMLIVEME